MIFHHPYLSLFLFFIVWRFVWRVLFFPTKRRSINLTRKTLIALFHVFRQTKSERMSAAEVLKRIECELGGQLSVKDGKISILK